MCTAIATQGEHFYFGRNMDLEGRFGERVVTVGREERWIFRNRERWDEHHAMMGMAFVFDGYPLFADAFNEHGLCMASLHFPGNAYYFEPGYHAKETVLAPFELIPWILGKCRDLEQARAELSGICLCDVRFRLDMPNTPLHWIIADRHGALAVEPSLDGLRVFDDPVGVLTNNPPFDFQMNQLWLYGNIQSAYQVDTVAARVGKTPFCLGLGGVGLPGDFSSPSRFAKAAWVNREISSWLDGTDADHAQMFSVMGSVAIPRGCMLGEKGEAHYTTYSSVMDPERGLYLVRDGLENTLQRVHLQDREYALS